MFSWVALHALGLWFDDRGKRQYEGFSKKIAPRFQTITLERLRQAAKPFPSSGMINKLQFAATWVAEIISLDSFWFRVRVFRWICSLACLPGSTISAFPPRSIATRMRRS